MNVLIVSGNIITKGVASMNVQSAIFSCCLLCSTSLLISNRIH